MIEGDTSGTRCYRAGEIVCPLCEQSEWTWLRRWYLGRDTAWFCDFCFAIIPPVRLVP